MMQRSRGVVLGLLVAVVLGACTGAPGDGNGPGEKKTPAAAPSARATHVPEATPHDELVTRADDVRRRPVPALDELDLREATVAPTLREAPVPRAVLVAQLGIFDPEPGAEAAGVVAGEPYLLTPQGEWRRVEVTDFGVSPNGELPVALSPDGRRLAIGGVEPGRLVIIDLSSGDTISKRMPIDVPAYVQWSQDGTEVSWFDRHKNEDFYRFDVATEEITVSHLERLRTGYVGAGTQVAEVLGRGILRVHDGDTVIEQELEYPLLARRRTRVADGGDLLAWGRYRPTKDGSAASVVAVDPADGRLVGVLSPPSQGRFNVAPEQWLAGDQLLLTTWPSGAFYVWSPRARELVQIGGFVTNGTYARMATDVLRDLLM